MTARRAPIAAIGTLGPQVGKVIADISMSLDGFVTGPGPDLEHGLGLDGEPLHAWAMNSEDPIDVAALRDATSATGAVVMGRRLFDFVDGPQGWSEQLGYGGREAATPPFFVVTHAAPARRRLTELDFTFVEGGLSTAILAAREAAGALNAVVMGGATVVAEAVALGLADELHIHLAPLLLGSGTRLFADGPRRDLVQQDVRVSRHATHLTYLIA